MTAKRGSIVYGPYREWHITSVSVINILKRPTGVTITIVFSRRVSWWTGESEYSPHTIRLRGVYLSRRHQDRANSSPSPHYFTILASRSTLPRLASASSLAIFLERILPPENFLAASPSSPPTLLRLLRSISNHTPKHENLSLSLSLSSIYLSIYSSSRFSIRSEIYKSLSPNPGPPSVTRHELPPKNQKNHTWLEVSFFSCDSSTIPPDRRINHHNQEPPPTSPPSSRLTHSNKFLSLFHTLSFLLLLPLLFPFHFSHFPLLRPTSNDRRQGCVNRENRQRREHCRYVSPAGEESVSGA